jgi:glycerol-3-phosphate responsive antiterminator
MSKVTDVGNDFAHVSNMGSAHHVCERTWDVVEVLPGCVSSLCAHSVLGGVAITALLLF